ncbi:hypothetical protein [Mangrovivirga cuniculi]|uniref:SMP-30/Gluconolaconase/LRE-like region-containing protein n=1 Tax=Mangrovivirga cuniculi TaxID=2715131 RepID=A0A4D7JJ80_9BACT|nr:hypothetical protein [Mangrovivirga cuniculi]QCK13460.1 hypothetical protein DCC35_01180 [Mangrovivirga cuniculi]
MKRTMLMTVAIAMVILNSCTNNDEIVPEKQPENFKIETANEDLFNERHTQLPEEITINFPGLYPEGIAFNPWKKEFYVSSARKGIITSVDFEGNIVPLTEKGDLITTTGMDFSYFTQKLYACNGDAGVSEYSSPSTIAQLAEVAALKQKHNSDIELSGFDLSGIYPGPQFLNDLVRDWYGNTYITDSFSPVIYKIDRYGNESVFAESELFQAPAGNFGLNGIIWSPKGYLIAAKYDEGKLFKVSTIYPAKIQEIQIDQNIASPDGLLMINPNTILMVGNNLGQANGPVGVYKLQSFDNWKTAKVVDFMPVNNSFPTTLTRVYNEVYVLYGEINKLLTGAPEVQSFKIKKVKF